MIQFISSWSLRTYGFHNPNPSDKKRAYTPTEEKLKSTMKMELDSAKRVVLKRAQKPPSGMEKKKVADEMRSYYGFLKDVAKVFSRRQLEELGIDSRDLAGMYDLELGSRSKVEKEADDDGDYGYDYKRGYNTGVFDDVLKLGDDSDKNVEAKDNYDFEDFKRDLLDVLEDLDKVSSNKNHIKHNRYVDGYNKRKKEIERQKRINALLDDLEEYLKRRK